MEVNTFQFTIDTRYYQTLSPLNNESTALIYVASQLQQHLLKLIKILF